MPRPNVSAACKGPGRQASTNAVEIEVLARFVPESWNRSQLAGNHAREPGALADPLRICESSVVQGARTVEGKSEAAGSSMAVRLAGAEPCAFGSAPPAPTQSASAGRP